jgi:hypothetical protein
VVLNAQKEIDSSEYNLAPLLITSSRILEKRLPFPRSKKKKTEGTRVERKKRANHDIEIYKPIIILMVEFYPLKWKYGRFIANRKILLLSTTKKEEWIV